MHNSCLTNGTGSLTIQALPAEVFMPFLCVKNSFLHLDEKACPAFADLLPELSKNLFLVNKNVFYLCPVF